MAVAW
jgi:hypothetical protein